mmetsp:Transcript_16258/g.35252  ORF Transcript_16258/g.35252 Transcript_16258/m.35252 type:complete len:229 (-) Transcript_16258:41-727(-)
MSQALEQRPHCSKSSCNDSSSISVLQTVSCRQHSRRVERRRRHEAQILADLLRLHRDVRTHGDKLKRRRCLISRLPEIVRVRLQLLLLLTLCVLLSRKGFVQVTGLARSGGDCNFFQQLSQRSVCRLSMSTNTAKRLKAKPTEYFTQRDYTFLHHGALRPITHHEALFPPSQSLIQTLPVPIFTPFHTHHVHHLHSHPATLQTLCNSPAFACFSSCSFFFYPHAKRIR